MRAVLASVLAAAVLSPCVFAKSSERAKLIEHKIKRGQTLAELAVEYYEDRDRYESLARINDIKPPFRLKTGRILNVPISGLYEVKSGDTPSGIAEELLGGASRYAPLLEMNGMSLDSPLMPGQELEIPAILEYKMEKGETLGELAKRYYGDASRARWLAAYNAIEAPDRVERGTRLEIPLIGFLPGRQPVPPKPSPPERKGAAPEPAPAAARPPTAPPKAEPKAPEQVQERPPDPALQHAVDLYHQGNYRRAASELDGILDKGSLRLSEKTTALRYRAYCAVAMGDAPTVGRTFRALHDLAPSWKPDPIEDSPKIRNAFSTATSSPAP